MFDDVKNQIEEDFPYLHSEVKLEVGARSLLEPTAEAAVTSVLEDALPINTTIKQVLIPTAFAEKTFLEKSFLLNELFSSQTPREAKRKSRHRSIHNFHHEHLFCLYGILFLREQAGGTARAKEEIKTTRVVCIPNLVPNSRKGYQLRKPFMFRK